MSDTGHRGSRASLHLSACPVHLTQAHALLAPQKGVFSPQYHSYMEARSCTPKHPGPIPSGSQAWRGITDKATLMPQCSPGLSAYFLLYCVASSGNWHFKTAHFIFLGNEELVLALALALAPAGSPVGEEPGPPRRPPPLQQRWARWKAPRR